MACSGWLARLRRSCWKLEGPYELNFLQYVCQVISTITSKYVVVGRAAARFARQKFEKQNCCSCKLRIIQHKSRATIRISRASSPACIVEQGVVWTKPQDHGCGESSAVDVSYVVCVITFVRVVGHNSSSRVRKCANGELIFIQNILRPKLAKQYGNWKRKSKTENRTPKIAHRKSKTLELKRLREGVFTAC